MKRKLVLPLAILAAALAACGLAACNDTGNTPGGDTPGGNVPGGNAGNEYLVFETLADGSLQVSADSGKEMPEEIVIPSEYEGKPVTAVKAQGFALNHAEGLERVVIPEGVKSIGENAFYNLITLESAVLPDSLIEMGMYAFAGCAALFDIEFGSGLSVIPVGAFGGCAIASLTLPETVTDIYYDAFRGCRKLTSVTLPDSVTYLGSSVFAECEALTEVTLPKGLASIENATFRACGSLVKIEIPAGVKSIGSSAFDGCALNKIALPEGVASIGNEAFKDCAFEEIEIPKSVTTIGADASRDEWAAALERALASAREKNSLFVLQRFRKPARLEHALFDARGVPASAFGRARVCPYYFLVRDGGGRSRARLGGALCTFCPPDKKIIHGMSSAALFPCAL